MFVDSAALTTSEMAAVRNVAPWLANTCRRLLSQEPNALEAYLTTVCSSVNIADTQASIHCHLIAHDGNNRPRVDALAAAIADRLIEYCIPRKEFDQAKKKSKNSAREWVRLEKKAKALFTELANSGEGGEMLLYVLNESILGLPQLLCKMSLKTSGQVHYHGVDGIHGTVDEATGRLALYWGESKLYADLNNAIRECFESVAPFLLESGGSTAAHNRDLHLVRDNLDLRNPKLERAIKKYLDPDDPSYKLLEFRASCLVGFNCDAYPSVPNTKIEAQIRGEIEAALAGWKDKLKSHVLKQKLQTFVVEVFCLPFPDVDNFRKAFKRELGIG